MSEFTIKVTKVKKNVNGDITDLMMDDGNVYSMDEAIIMAKHNIIEGVKIKQPDFGSEYLISDETGDYDINKLPKF